VLSSSTTNRTADASASPVGLTKAPAPAPRPASDTAGRGGPTDPSHDENLRRGILPTAISRRTAWGLAVTFLALIYAVPLGQIVRDKLNDEPSVLVDLFARAPTKDNIKQFEDDLQKASTPRETLRPYVQELFTRWGGFGNTKGVIGHDPAWLFYAPGVTAMGGPGFLDADIHAMRENAALDEGNGALAADPRPAVLALATYLRRRGIALVLFPVPDKASLQPVELHGRARGANGPVGRNPDTDAFISEMRRQGVFVFDPTPASLRAGETPRYLVQDTHWTPAWMEEVAVALAALVSHETALGPAATPRSWQTKEITATRRGDIADMLALPRSQTLYAPSTISLHQVIDDQGNLFEPREDAEVLLLGDSFTNIYGLDQMGWGEGAGLAAHLARNLGRDLDVIAQNDAGAFATRLLLSQALADADTTTGRDRLTGKKVVIWEFASRELAVGNWKPVSWPEQESGPTVGSRAGRRPRRSHAP